MLNLSLINFNSKIYNILIQEDITSTEMIICFDEQMINNTKKHVSTFFN